MQVTRIIFILSIAVSFWFTLINSALGAEVAREYQLKAAYLYNFARFISWPDQSFPSADGNLNICVIGNNPFASILSELESRKIDNHALKIHYSHTVSYDALHYCHLAFYQDSLIQQKMRELTAKLSNTVHVSDLTGFAGSGGDIQFILSQDRLRFIINNSSMKAKGLHPSASLLELAAEIY